LRDLWENAGMDSFLLNPRGIVGSGKKGDTGRQHLSTDSEKKKTAHLQTLPEILPGTKANCRDTNRARICGQRI